jgi:hypothetical protein
LIPQSSGYAAFPQPLIHNFWLYLDLECEQALQGCIDRGADSTITLGLADRLRDASQNTEQERAGPYGWVR